MRKITYCNWLGYASHRLKFRNICMKNGVGFIEKYKAPNRYLYCRSRRAVLVRRGFSWGKCLPIYMSSFCDATRCVYKGTCAICPHNLNNK